MISLTFRVIRDPLLMGISSWNFEFKGEHRINNSSTGTDVCRRTVTIQVIILSIFILKYTWKCYINGFFSVIIWMNLIIFKFVTSHVIISYHIMGASFRPIVILAYSVFVFSSCINLTMRPVRSSITYGLLIHILNR